jgi:RHS repeat-associated protein
VHLSDFFVRRRQLTEHLHPFHLLQQYITACIALGCLIVGLLVPAKVQALPASCSTAGNFCTAPVVTPWRYVAHDGRGDLGPFDSEAEAIAAVVGRGGGGWCSVTFNSITYDDNTGWGGTPFYQGNIDTHHGNTGHFTVVGYTSDGCQQSWAYNIGITADRDVKCLKGTTRINDTSVTPAAPLCQGSHSTVQTTKTQGVCDDCNSQVWKGNPANITHGNKYQSETDYQSAGVSPIRIIRSYNSLAVESTTIESEVLQTFGRGWTATYFQRLLRTSVAIGATSLEAIYAFRPDGRVLVFRRAGSDWVRVGEDVSDTLTSTGSGYEYRASDNTVETYDTLGRLIFIRMLGRAPQTVTYAGGSLHPSSVSDGFGHSISFAYTFIAGSARLTSITDQSNTAITYAYNSTYGRLNSVTYQDGTQRKYTYDGAHRLTSLTDEANIVYATWTYGTYNIASSEHAGGVEHYDFPTANASTISVTDPFGVSRSYTTAIAWGVRRLKTSSGTCTGCREDKARTYDTNGNVATRKDFNNNQTTFTFDLTRNLETSRTEAYGTALARTISTSWHPSFRLPSQIIEPTRTTTFSHDADGNVLTRTVTDAGTGQTRTWNYSYNSFGQVLTENGPRTDVSDVTTYTYYICTTGIECGQLHAVTNALGQTTTYLSYNAHGQPLTMSDANGVLTTLTYDLRQRLTSRTTASESTGFEYWPTGLLKKVTLPNGSFVLYTYDAAHRLTKIEDAEGNRVEYTLDAMGNRTSDKAYDPSSALARTRTQVFNTLNQLWKQIGAAGTTAVTTVHGYDTNGNQTTTNAPLARNSANAYDELNRLKQITDPGNGVTQFGYDANDNLTSVTDPRSLTTSYTYNGFGDLTQQVSPDSGTTSSTYDAVGNLATRTDARNKTGTYTYDALNRLTSISYPDQITNFSYDSGTHGIGRLTGASDANHSLAWTYDALGRVTGKDQTVGSLTKSIGYGYGNGNLTSIVTPSGQMITYGYANGKISSIAVNGTTFLSNVLYEPFGPVSGWTWSNGTIAARVYDLDGKPTDIDSSGAYTYSYDDAFRITGITDQADATKSWMYGYDLLDRLNNATRSSQTIGYTYDANGNRLTQTGTQVATYTVAGSSNRLSSIVGTPARAYSYDASGNTTGDGTLTFTYSDAGRMNSVTSGAGTTSYIVNALGQRVKKWSNGSTTLFMYDESGHLVGEYDGTGALIQETVWMGDIPVATLRPNGGGVTLYYVHTDHLNTPRRVGRPSDNTVVWRWDADPFGAAAADQDPDGDSVTFLYGLRLPGQYYDAESGLNYNYYRDGYDPSVGRYTQSDPIGLNGGINTYAYGLNNPVLFIDPLGLDAAMCRALLRTAGTIAIGVPAAACGCAIGGVLGGGGGTLVGGPVVGTAAGAAAGCAAVGAVGGTVGAAAGAAAGDAAADAMCSDEDPERCEKAKQDARSRYLKLTTKRVPQYQSGGTGGSDAGHYQAILQLQQALQDAIRRVKLYCKPLPLELPEWERAANEVITPQH